MAFTVRLVDGSDYNGDDEETQSVETSSALVVRHADRGSTTYAPHAWVWVKQSPYDSIGVY